MTGDAVLHNESSDWCVGMFGEEHIVADTEADDDVHICPGLVQEPGLRYRVAGRLKGRRPHLIILCDAE